MIKRDSASRFRFASLQSQVGGELLSRIGIDPDVTDSIVLIEQGRAFDQSTAALRIVRHLDKLWPIFYAFVVVPKPLRDSIYRAVAKRRYRWFGMRATCRLPTPEERARFLG